MGGQTLARPRRAYLLLAKEYHGNRLLSIAPLHVTAPAHCCLSLANPALARSCALVAAHQPRRRHAAERGALLPKDGVPRRDCVTCRVLGVTVWRRRDRGGSPLARSLRARRQKDRAKLSQRNSGQVAANCVQSLCMRRQTLQPCRNRFRSHRCRGETMHASQQLNTLRQASGRIRPALQSRLAVRARRLRGGCLHREPSGVFRGQKSGIHLMRQPSALSILREEWTKSVHDCTHPSPRIRRRSVIATSPGGAQAHCEA